MENYYQKAWKMALRVDFLKEKEEIAVYARALYNAMEWGKRVK